MSRISLSLSFMKMINILYKVGAVVLLLGAALKMAFPQEAAYIYTAGALLFAVAQFFARPRSRSFVLRRLVFQQQIGAICLVAAGVLMFTHVRNEWIVAMFIGALFELYTSFRIPQEIEKEK